MGKYAKIIKSAKLRNTVINYTSGKPQTTRVGHLIDFGSFVHNYVINMIYETYAKFILNWRAPNIDKNVRDGN